MSRLLASGILIGIGIGSYIPSLPGPLSSINAYLGLILIVAGILLLISAK